MNLIKILATKIGQTFYSPAYGEVILFDIFEAHKFPLKIKVKSNNEIIALLPDGKRVPTGEVMLFPSKENRDWATLYHINKPAINALLDLVDTNKLISFLKENLKVGDKVKTFDSLVKNITYGVFKFHGVYANNSIKEICEYLGESIYEIELSDHFYTVEMFDLSYILYNNPRLVYLVKENLDSLKREIYKVLNLKPFDKVLVRDTDDSKWQIDFFQNYTKNGFECLNTHWEQCVSYDADTQDLLGTTNKPRKKYRFI